ncbi:MAG: hypothetical protein R3B48_29845 [Kofleriaceae bacterium]
MSALFSACVVAPAQPTTPMASNGAPGPAPAPTGEIVAGPSGQLLPYHGPLSCDGADDLALDSVEIHLQGPGLAVNGSCDIEIRNSRIIAEGGPALIVSGSGDILVSNSYVAGQPSMIISGSGTIRAVQTEIEGDLVISGSGDLDLQGNLIRGRTTVTGSGDVRDAGNQWQ